MTTNPTTAMFFGEPASEKQPSIESLELPIGPYCTDKQYPLNIYCDDVLGTCIASCEPSQYEMKHYNPDIRQQVAKLLTASANSYMANAVDPEAAEQDLPGESLALLRRLKCYMDGTEIWTYGAMATMAGSNSSKETTPSKLVEAFLAKAKPLP